MASTWVVCTTVPTPLRQFQFQRFESVFAQLTREQVDELELQRGQIVYVRPTRQTVFAG